MDIREVKAAAAGRTIEVLEAVAGIPRSVLDGRHHPCPLCGGVDRFRLVDKQDGAVYCNHCFASGNGDFLAAIQWTTGQDFAGSLRLAADYLGVQDGRTESPGVDIVEQVARTKRCPAASLKAYGASAALSATGQVCRVPMYDEAGQICTHFDITPTGKGRCAKGRSAGVFLPGRMPKRGETWMLVEGVKDAARLHGEGFHAIGVNGTSLSPKFARLLAGCVVRVIPDLDEAAFAGAEKTVACLSGIARSVAIVRMPGQIKKSGGSDVRDLLDSDGGLDSLKLAIKDADESAPCVKLELVPMESYESRDVEWLWQDRIAAGKLNLLVGDPGSTKTFLGIYILAAATRGWPMADESEQIASRTPRNVILVSAEDDAEDTLRPRLEASGADLSRVLHLTGVELDGRQSLFNLSSHVDLLTEAMAELRPAAILFDTLNSFVGRLNTNANTDVRDALLPVVRAAAKYKVALIGIEHLNKNSTLKSVHRVSGSMAFVGLARTCWSVCEDDEREGVRLVTRIKNNLSSKATGLAYRLINRDGARQPHVEFLDEVVTRSADEAMAGSQPKNLTESCSQWLLRYLDGGVRRTTDEVLSAAAELGFNKDCVYRARRQLPEVDAQRISERNGPAEWFIIPPGEVGGAVLNGRH